MYLFSLYGIFDINASSWSAQAGFNVRRVFPITDDNFSVDVSKSSLLYENNVVIIDAENTLL